MGDEQSRRIFRVMRGQEEEPSCHGHCRRVNSDLGSAVRQFLNHGDCSPLVEVDCYESDSDLLVRLVGEHRDPLLDTQVDPVEPTARGIGPRDLCLMVCEGTDGSCSGYLIVSSAHPLARQPRREGSAHLRDDEAREQPTWLPLEA